MREGGWHGWCSVCLGPGFWDRNPLKGVGAEQTGRRHYRNSYEKPLASMDERVNAKRKGGENSRL